MDRRKERANKSKKPTKIRPFALITEKREEMKGKRAVAVVETRQLRSAHFWSCERVFVLRQGLQ